MASLKALEWWYFRLRFYFMEVCSFTEGQTSQHVLILLGIRGTWFTVGPAVVEIVSITEVGLCLRCWKYSKELIRSDFKKPQPGVLWWWVKKNFPLFQTAFDSAFQFSLVAQSCPTLCSLMDHSKPGLPARHQLPEFIQTHVHWVSDVIQPSHPLSSPLPPALNLSQHQGLFQWVSFLHQVAKVLEFQLQHQSFQWIFRTDFL